MSFLCKNYYLLRISIVAVACLLGFCAGWIFKDPFVKLILGERKTIETEVMVEEQPVVKLTPEQEIFWQYLEQFNRLPENPTEEMVAVTKTKGIAPEFHYLKASKKSVIGDIKSLTAHKDIFIKRYSWVQPLLDSYSIEIPISAERFSGAVQDIGEKYRKLMNTAKKAPEDSKKEKNYVSNYLEGLLVVDFIYARGSSLDKLESTKIVEGVFSANFLYSPIRKKLEPNFMSPASKDIGWAILADYPKLCRGLGSSNVLEGFDEHSPSNKIDFCKWMLKTKDIPQMDSEAKRGAYRGIIHNELVNFGMLNYAIFSAHWHEVGRPADRPWLIVIEILFKRFYPEDHGDRYKEYLSLLDAAYPKIEP